jgi:hypothetical protein
LAIAASLALLAVGIGSAANAFSDPSGQAVAAKKKCKKAKRSAVAAKKCKRPIAPPPSTTPVATTPTTTSTPTITMPVEVDIPPVAVADSPPAINEDAGATAIDVMANDTDVDGGIKSVASKTDGAHGTVAITGGGTGVSYTPAANYCGSDSFTYTLNGGSSTTVTITVTCVDDPPVAVDDAASTPMDTQLIVTDSTLLANDTDLDGPYPLLLTAVQDPSHGTVALSSGNVTFTPETGFCGPASFDYTVSDGTLSDTGHVDVTVC